MKCSAATRSAVPASKLRNEEPQRLQDEFQRGILAEDDAILAEVNDSAKEDRKVPFSVYRHAYVARLAEIVDEDYEQVHAYLGNQAFARLVKAYIAAHPSD